MMKWEMTTTIRNLLRPLGLSFFIFLIFHISSFAQIHLPWEEISHANTGHDFRAFKAAAIIGGDSITAYYTITNVKNGNLVFYPDFSAQNKKPEHYLEEAGEDIIALTNSGYFGTNVSYSLLINNYQLSAKNAGALSRSFNGETYTYYPTRSAFGIHSSLESEGGYVYTLSTNNETYIYPQPSPNTTAALPFQQPSPSYPENGIPWKVSDAVGGGPLLIKGGIRITDYTPELFPADIISSIAPRTAIGKTAEGEIIMLIVDGRQTHSKGVSLAELTDILLDLNCTDAMNLDGGGSSCLFIGNDLINQPSDGSTRSIPTFVTIRKATKLFADSSQHFFRNTPAMDSVNISAFNFTKSLFWDEEDAGGFKLNITDPAAYRIEYVFPEIIPYNICDRIFFSLNQESNSTNSFSINTNGISSQQFAYLGTFQLGHSDTLFIKNPVPGSILPICGIRLTKIGSGLPSLSLEPAIYSGKHTYQETLKLKFKAEANNPDREISAYAIYESGENGLSKLKKEEFNPKSIFLDSLEYEVKQMQGQIKIIFAIFDEKLDSIALSYAINIDDAPPTISLGKNSVLQAGLKDTLIFELKVLPANDNRLLEELTIIKQSDTNPVLLETIHPNEYGDTILYMYEIGSNDIPGINFRFTILDQQGYSSYRDYSLAVNSTDVKTLKPQIYFNSQLKQLHIGFNIKPNRDIRLDIISIDGRLIMNKTLGCDSNQIIDASYLRSGIYIARMHSKEIEFHYKFIVSEK